MNTFFSSAVRLAIKHEEINCTRKKRGGGYHFYRVYGSAMELIHTLISKMQEQATEGAAVEVLRMAIDQAVEQAEPLNDAYLDALDKGEKVYETWFASALNKEYREALLEVYKSLA